ncbi:single-stranded DNA-binding protein [Wielerella bovis]|uniref:single-stranded DNA-binding protein n=1 Tax=Wielerella bovis TaxID=2917790 RepID=UPI002019A156|nr:single-stranded DNA-binding protein [Wielerella bovis]ULJ59764.1 single-stranded DNA-binding protein [Wielerella bovis]
MHNLVILIGNLGKDPEIRHMPNGDPVASFSLATSETWIDKQGQKRETTQWHNIVCYRGTAKIAQDWLKKGKLICIEGKIVYRQWQDEHQVTHYKTEIIAEQIQMLGKKDD